MANTDIFYTTRAKLKALYDAIRAKAGTSSDMTIDQAITAVENIPTGGGDEDIQNILKRADTNWWEYFDFDFTAHGMDYVPDYALFNGDKVYKVTLPIFLRNGNRTDIGVSAFNHCTNMILNSDEITCGIIDDSAFASCVSIVVRRLDCTQINQGAFSNCQDIKYLAIVCSGEINNAFPECYGLQKVWVNKEATIPASDSALNSPFYECSNLTDIYTDATEKPSGWGDYFNYTSFSTQATVHYGVSEAEFDAIVEAEEAAS